jgi:hypothetical protein
LQKIINYNNILEEKPLQYLLNYQKNMKKYEKNPVINKIYGFGLNNYGQLSLDQRFIISPKEIKYFKDMEIKKIFLGNLHSIIIASIIFILIFFRK